MMFLTVSELQTALPEARSPHSMPATTAEKQDFLAALLASVSANKTAEPYPEEKSNNLGQPRRPSKPVDSHLGGDGAALPFMTMPMMLAQAAIQGEQSGPSDDSPSKLVDSHMSGDGVTLPFMTMPMLMTQAPTSSLRGEQPGPSDDSPSEPQATPQLTGLPPADDMSVDGLPMVQPPPIPIKGPGPAPSTQSAKLDLSVANADLPPAAGVAGSHRPSPTDLSQVLMVGDDGSEPLSNLLDIDDAQAVDAVASIAIAGPRFVLHAPDSRSDDGAFGLGFPMAISQERPAVPERVLPVGDWKLQWPAPEQPVRRCGDGNLPGGPSVVGKADPVKQEALPFPAIRPADSTGQGIAGPTIPINRLASTQVISDDAMALYSSQHAAPTTLPNPEQPSPMMRRSKNTPAISLASDGGWLSRVTTSRMGDPPVQTASENPLLRQVEKLLNDAKQVIMTTGRATDMAVVLEPQELGKLTVKVSMEDGVANARFHAESHAVKQLIEAELPRLKQLLHDQGIRLDQVMVQVGGEPSEGFGQSQQWRSFTNKRMAPKSKNAAGSRESQPAVVSVGHRVTGLGHRIDYMA